MQERLIHTLRKRRARIRARWETYLRIERTKTPLANPDTLIYLFDQTLDQLFVLLRAPDLPPPPAPRSCACGRHPLLAYFIAGEQALLEALVLAQTEIPGLDPTERDAAVGELKLAMYVITTNEIESFAGICRHHTANNISGIKAAAPTSKIVDF